MAKKGILFERLGKTPTDKIINIVIVIVVGVILFFIIKSQWSKIKDLFSNAKKDLNKELAAGGKLSFKESEYDNMAETLYTALKGFGTDEDAIYNVFWRVNTLADVLKIVSVYGTKNGETLNQWLLGDLSSSEVKKLNDILTTKGIDYKF